MSAATEPEAIVSTEAGQDETDIAGLCDIMDEMRKSMASARDVVRTLREK